MECKNCGIPHEGKYCSECGQKVITDRITLHHIFAELVSIITNLERGFWYTYKMLFINPGEVIRSYLDGQTVRYYPPLRYLLLWVAVSVGISLSTGVFDQQQKSMEAFTVQSKKPEVAALQHKMQQKIQTEIRKYMNFLPLFILPFMALASFWITRRQGLNYAEHLILNSYAYAQTTSMGAFVQLIIFIFPALLPFLALKVMLLNIIYYTHVFKTLFQKSILIASLKATLAIILGFAMCFLFFGLIGTVAGIFLALKMKGG